MRKLLYIPAVHDLSETCGIQFLASFAVESQSKARKQYKAHENFLERYWTEVVNRLNRHVKEIDKVYCEGIYHGGNGALKELKGEGITYSLVKKLTKKLDIPLMKTESKSLYDRRSSVMQELMNITLARSLVQKDQDKQEFKDFFKESKQKLHEYNQKADEICNKCDAYISKRIQMTLQNDETGLLILGAGHHIKLKGIKVISLYDKGKVKREAYKIWG